MKWIPIKRQLGEASDYQDKCDMIYVWSGPSKHLVFCSGIILSKTGDRLWEPTFGDEKGHAEYVETTRFDTFKDAARAARKAYARYMQEGRHPRPLTLQGGEWVDLEEMDNRPLCDGAEEVEAEEMHGLILEWGKDDE
jgi:hypothetical protein